MKNTYTAGQLAELAGVSSRTVRYYDQKGLLKPIAYSEGGYRLYDDVSLSQLQKIKQLQFSGLSLEEIGRIVIGQESTNITEILWDRKMLLIGQRDRINQMISSLDNVIYSCKDIRDENENIRKAFEILKLTNMESSFDKQFALYEAYSENQKQWHPWVFEQMQLFPGAKVLDMGSGHGMVWIRNWTVIPEGMVITVVDKLNAGMNYLEKFYRENKRFLQSNVEFVFLRQDLEKDFAFEETYDRVIANHLWKFICDAEGLMQKVKAALTTDGLMISTLSSYGVVEQVNKLLGMLELPVDFSEEERREAKEHEQTEKSLRTVFPNVIEQVFENKLTGIDNAKIIMQYIENKFPAEYIKKVALWQKCTEKLNQYFEEHGTVTISNFTSLYQCRKE